MSRAGSHRLGTNSPSPSLWPLQRGIVSGRKSAHAIGDEERASGRREGQAQAASCSPAASLRKNAAASGVRRRYGGGGEM